MNTGSEEVVFRVITKNALSHWSVNRIDARFLNNKRQLLAYQVSVRTGREKDQGPLC